MKLGAAACDSAILLWFIGSCFFGLTCFTGCAFVVYDRWSSCEAAIAGLHGKTHLEGAKMPLVVKFADAKVGTSSSSLCLRPKTAMENRTQAQSLRTITTFGGG